MSNFSVISKIDLRLLMMAVIMVLTFWKYENLNTSRPYIECVQYDIV